MNKKGSINKIRRLFDEMRPILIEAGINFKFYELPEKDQVKVEWCHEALNWLKEIYESVYKDTLKIKELLPEEIWLRYKLWGDFDEHREVILLNTALRKLHSRMVVLKRPIFFKKGQWLDAKDECESANSNENCEGNGCPDKAGPITRKRYKTIDRRSEKIDSST